MRKQLVERFTMMLPGNRLVIWLDTWTLVFWVQVHRLFIHKPRTSSKHRRKHNGVVTELPWWRRSLWNFPVNPTERSSSLSAKPLPDASIDFDLQIYQTQRSSSVLINQKTLLINHDYWLLYWHEASDLQTADICCVIELSLSRVLSSVSVTVLLQCSCFLSALYAVKRLYCYTCKVRFAVNGPGLLQSPITLASAFQ